MKNEINIHFPCGYTYIQKNNMYVFIGKIEIDSNDLPICPIHGKNCKRSK